MIVFDGPVSAELAEALGGRMFDRWSRALGRRGLSAVEHRGGLDVRQVRMTGDSIDRVAEYLAKITAEITSPSTKESSSGNRSPFAILRDALATGMAEDCELWLAWEQGSHGRRQLTWSRDLRAWAGVNTERTDEETPLLPARIRLVMGSAGRTSASRRSRTSCWSTRTSASLAIVAMPDEQLGERACAFVVISRHDLDLATLAEWLDGRRIARQKYLEKLVVVPELPKTGAGKIQKFKLRERLRGEATVL